MKTQPARPNFFERRAAEMIAKHGPAGALRQSIENSEKAISLHDKTDWQWIAREVTRMNQAQLQKEGF